MLFLCNSSIYEQAIAGAVARDVSLKDLLTIYDAEEEDDDYISVAKSGIIAGCKWAKSASQEHMRHVAYVAGKTLKYLSLRDALAGMLKESMPDYLRCVSSKYSKEIANGGALLDENGTFTRDGRIWLKYWLHGANSYLVEWAW